MPDIHVPHLEEEDHHTAKPRSRWKSAVKIGLKIVLITTGVFLGLAGEFRGNRGEVLHSTNVC